MPRSLLTTQDIVVLFQKQRMSPAKIAVFAGISRQGVWKKLKHVGANKDFKLRTWTQAMCGMCGKEFSIRWITKLKSHTNYCSQACVYASLESPGYKPWRQGGRLAVAIVQQHFKIPLGGIVHHKDGDNRNNDLANLSVFANNSDHLKAHHAKTKVEPIWDGASVER